MMTRCVEAWVDDPATELVQAVLDGKVLGWACGIRKSSPAEVKGDGAEPQEKTPRSLGRFMHEEMVRWETKCTAGTEYMALQALAVHPENQGQGVGRKLVEWVLGKADVKGMACWAHASPASAGLYERLGFKEMGRSEYDLGAWCAGEVQGDYTFRYMLRPASAG